jgi:hypothetical protein
MKTTALLRSLVAAFACAFALCASAQTKTEQPAGTGLKPKPAADAPKKPAAEEENAGVKAVEKIFGCVAEGLPKEWRRAWVVVTELQQGDKERKFEGRFFYSLDDAGKQPLVLKPCDAREVAEGVYKLNDFLEYEKRGWKVATLIFTSDGKFEIKYDYVK